MAEPVLTEIFGANAIQDANSLTIDKNDLVAIGLTPSATNTAESLLAAIIAIAQQTLTAVRQDTHPEQSVVIEDSLESLVTRGDQVYRQLTKTISFEKPDSQSAFDPDDY
ncbi:hypothetical protein Riv7116_1843 [Rivularia sp. PCC 7116]|uniref:hypothetical protein n=1 Tax=Rivularia sp. PCC 7116 TaxID=373994 RepID=UPI00029F41AB|nr:hypothetical protein [Rivularia sp. PCC 7116]AFY54384.1 hypothetical protein Riv7116_1843 [Rivularia sp. PCC 7116]